MMSVTEFEIINSGGSFTENIAEAEKMCFSEPWSKQAIEDFLSFDYNGVTVVLCNGEFAGYVTYTCICDELQIANVATVPEYRRIGVASCLMKSIEQTARDKSCNVITLEVRASNVPAIALYKKQGFKEVGVRKGFYKNPKDDAVLMNFEL